MSSWVRCQRSVSHHSDREGVPCLADMKVTCPVPRGAGAHIRPAAVCWLQGALRAPRQDAARASHCTARAPSPASPGTRFPLALCAGSSSVSS